MKKLHFNVPNKILYLNWRGVVRERVIVPHHIWFGATEYHSEPQFLIEATDTEKGEKRHFALKDMTILDGQKP